MASVFLIGEHKDGHLKRVTLEILGECNRQNIPVVVVLVGSKLAGLTDELSVKGANQIVLLEHELLAQYSSEGYAQALYNFISKHNPTAIVTGATSQGKDFLPRLAAKFSAGIATDCIEFSIAGENCTVRRPVYAGKCTKAVTFKSKPALFSVRPNVLAVPGDKAVSSKTETIAAEPGNIRTRLIEVLMGTTKKVELTEADIIISGGRSLKNSDNFKILHECAAVIGAAVGASRAAVDAGYAPHDMQVGQTGKTVSPKLYIACGISGAIQHLAGMRTAKVIVAINKDSEAPIFQKADFGIVGDLFEIVPLLTQELKKLKAQS